VVLHINTKAGLLYETREEIPKPKYQIPITQSQITDHIASFTVPLGILDFGSWDLDISYQVFP
jgi:hypothetical protein